jgi:hypothetical protein
VAKFELRTSIHSQLARDLKTANFKRPFSGLSYCWYQDIQSRR